MDVNPCWAGGYFRPAGESAHTSGQVVWAAPIAQDLLRAVHIIEEQFERLCTRWAMPPEFGPFGCRDDRGRTSSGNGRSFPDNENVTPWSMNAFRRASIRASRSSRTGFCQRLFEDAAVCRAYLTAGVEHLVVGFSERRRAGVAAEERALDLAWLGGRGLRERLAGFWFCCLWPRLLRAWAGSLSGVRLAAFRCRRGTHNLTWCWQNPNSVGLLSD